MVRCSSIERSVRLNGLSGICITKLDVLDGLDRVKICSGYRVDGKTRTVPVAGEMEHCEPVYEEMPGWQGVTRGMQDYTSLPANARAYLERIEELCEVPIAMVSTGPDRSETIMMENPLLQSGAEERT